MSDKSFCQLALSSFYCHHVASTTLVWSIAEATPQTSINLTKHALGARALQVERA